MSQVRTYAAQKQECRQRSQVTIKRRMPGGRAYSGGDATQAKRRYKKRRMRPRTQAVQKVQSQQVAQPVRVVVMRQYGAQARRNAKCGKATSE